MTIPAFPLTWPVGWKRTEAHGRGAARFSKRAGHSGFQQGLTIADGVGRVRAEIARMGLGVGEVVVSTNLELRRDGFPRSAQSEPADPGVAVYWRDEQGRARCMAVDRYLRVADNLAAIAATLDALRSIERHGSAEILDRAYSGFAALPAPESARAWHVVLGCAPIDTVDVVRLRYRKLRGERHPDRGGSAAEFEELQKAWAAFCEARGVSE
ncbi:MAG: J domain-containing protein [Rudaea sp.]|uniref:J domain-containing protein n=1 Tax=unclassified Rudaea TaxID=2627037 RepID=UPI0010F77BE8|nr:MULTISPECIES: J domain-containing protein [unclassified Rudaea]MBN8884454.1 J domain-containing protein [Rudaea sp.]